MLIFWKIVRTYYMDDTKDHVFISSATKTHEDKRALITSTILNKSRNKIRVVLENCWQEFVIMKVF